VAIVEPNGSARAPSCGCSALLERPSEGRCGSAAVVVAGGKAARGAGAGVRAEHPLVEQRPVLLRGTVRENLGVRTTGARVRRIEVKQRVERTAAQLGIGPLPSAQAPRAVDGEVQACRWRWRAHSRSSPTCCARRARQLRPTARRHRRCTARSPKSGPPPARRLPRRRISWRCHIAGSDDVRPWRRVDCHRSRPRTCFRVDLPASGSGGDLKHVASARLRSRDHRTRRARNSRMPPTDIFLESRAACVLGAQRIRRTRDPTRATSGRERCTSRRMWA